MIVSRGVSDIICAYCGRPIVGGPFVAGNAGSYHPECVQSPFHKPMLGGQNTEWNAALEEAAKICHGMIDGYEDEQNKDVALTLAALEIRKLKR